jgi:hypothetical protein
MLTLLAHIDQYETSIVTPPAVSVRLSDPFERSLCTAAGDAMGVAVGLSLALFVQGAAPHAESVSAAAMSIGSVSALEIRLTSTSATS